PLKIVTVASGDFEQSLLTILPFRNCTGPVVPGLTCAGFGAASDSSSSPELAAAAAAPLPAAGALAAPAVAALSPARCGRTPYFCSVSKSYNCSLAAAAATR